MEEVYCQFSAHGKMGIKQFTDDQEGKVVVPAVYDFVAPLSDGVFQVNDGKKAGYVDLQGRPIFPLTDKAEAFCDFSGGLAAFCRGGLYGFIDKTGVEVIPPQFVHAEPFANGLAIIYNEADLYGAID